MVGRQIRPDGYLWAGLLGGEGLELKARQLEHGHVSRGDLFQFAQQAVTDVAAQKHLPEIALAGIDSGREDRGDHGRGCALAV